MRFCCFVSSSTYPSLHLFLSFFFFFNDTATTEIYTLSLHDALPICLDQGVGRSLVVGEQDRDVTFPPERGCVVDRPDQPNADRKSTRLNSSHTVISYAVFCLKKKKKEKTRIDNNRT